jgi:hypothetical protein
MKRRSIVGGALTALVSFVVPKRILASALLPSLGKTSDYSDPEEFRKAMVTVLKAMQIDPPKKETFVPGKGYAWTGTYSIHWPTWPTGAVMDDKFWAGVPRS